MCSIQRLQLILPCGSLPDAQLAEVLRAMPSLIELHLGDNAEQISKMLLAKFTASRGNHPLVPMLRSFHLDITVNDVGFNEEAFTDMIESRWRSAVARLDTIKINRYPAEILDFQPGTLGKLGKLVEGFKFVFVSDIGDLSI